MRGRRAGRGLAGVLVAALSVACEGGAMGPASVGATGSGPDTASTGSGGASSSTDAGNPDGGASDGGASWDPASLDPRIEVSMSGAPDCAGVGPEEVAPVPVRVLRTFPSSRWGCSGPATSDGQGDVAFPCVSAFPESGWNDLYSADGRFRGQIHGWSSALPTALGFVSGYTPFGPRENRFEFAWFDGAAWQGATAADATVAGHWIAANPGTSVLELWDDDAAGGGPATRWVDLRGNALRPPRPWPGVHFGAAGVDGRGRALVAYSKDPLGGTFLRWLEPDDSVGPEFGSPSDTLPGPGEIVPLAGSGVLLNRSWIVRSGATRVESAGWLQARTEPFAVVNGGRAYAFTATSASPPCSPTVQLYATGGTFCGTLSLYGAGDSCPQHADVGIDGTLIQSVPTDHETTVGSKDTLWRWWSGYLR